MLALKQSETLRASRLRHTERGSQAPESSRSSPWAVSQGQGRSMLPSSRPQDRQMVPHIYILEYDFGPVGKINIPKLWFPFMT